MKKLDIIEALIKGMYIKKQSYMSFKRNKLVRSAGTEIYYIGDTRIRSNQFEAISHLVKKDNEESTLSCVIYRLKS